MKIAIDVSPLKNSKLLQHRVRGTGFYIENLNRALLKYYPENKYIFFTRGEKLPKNIDLVHYPYFEPFFLSLPIFKSHKTIVTVHDLTPLVFPEHFKPGIRGALKWQVQKLALKQLDIIITDSESSKKDIVKFAGIEENKIRVVYLAPSERFKKIENTPALDSVKEKYKLPEKFVLYVGDVTWNKNLPRLIEAIKKLDVKLVLVGSALARSDFDKTNPWNQDLLKVQKMIENDKRFIKLGFVPTEDLVVLYNIARVFAMPSIYEGFGLPVLEAMSCGCPVVTTKEGSLKEIGGDAAYFVDGYSVDSIAEGVDKVFSDSPHKKNFLQKGLLQARRFSWRQTSEKTIGVYKGIV